MAPPKAGKRGSKRTKKEPTLAEISSQSVAPRDLDLGDTAKPDLEAVRPSPSGKRKEVADSQDELESDEEAAEPSPKRQKLPVRGKATRSAKSVAEEEVPLPNSTPRRARNGEVQDSEEEEEDGDTEVFKTPMERKHVIFDDDDNDNDEFVTPLEAPSRNPLEAAIAARRKEEQEDSDSDSDDAPPELFSSHAAQAKAKELKSAAQLAIQK